jgi:hypothetical protein
VGTADPNYCQALNLYVGSACNDNNPTTINDMVNANCECVGTPDPSYCPDWGAFVGSACDDGNEETENDILDGNCICLGRAVVKNATLVLANIIMPESGDQNQFLEIHVTLDAFVTFYIRNRWGNIVGKKMEQINAGSNVLWDGKLNGSILDAGVYTYALSIQLAGQAIVYKQGSVTLIR